LNWDEEQERLTWKARLLVSSPEAVFDELKRLSAKLRAQRRTWTDREYEVSLINQNERLINLGLAAYGTNKEVLKALYKHGLEPAQDEADASYKEGLRIGFLSNSTVQVCHFLVHFPDRIIGPEETRRVVNEASDNEVAALIQNPKVWDDLLEALYQRKGPFADTPEERWQQLIHMSASNARLVTEYEYSDSPDTGHYSIHKAIFGLLETAPVNLLSLRTLYHLLDKLDFQQVHAPERIDHVLGRWAKLPAPKEDSHGKGYFTSLNIRDEFRCLIAALYGRGYVDKKIVVLGNRDADDVALSASAKATAAAYGRGIPRQRHDWALAEVRRASAKSMAALGSAGIGRTSG
jgi:hypothetical protein